MEDKDRPKWTIGQVADKCNCHKNTVIYYDNGTDLKSTRFGSNKVRFFTDNDVIKLKKILKRNKK